MNIIREGKVKTHTTKFECGNCGCEFECVDDEYWVDRTEVLTCYPARYYAYANCPVCHKVCKTSIEKENSSTYVCVNRNSVTVKSDDVYNTKG